jgi:2-C-methyl-D-erythritol 4-phosphate cytidylyltransferase
MATEHLFTVILPAAGSGRRFGGGDKLLTRVGRQSVLQRSVGLFAGRPEVAQLILVTAEERFDTYTTHLAETLTAGQLARVRCVAGGRERWESVLFGLRAAPAGCEFVAVHDAARPLTPTAVIDAAFAGAVAVGGSVPCVPEPATLKRRGADGQVAETVRRDGLFQAQTPQCFRRDRLLEAYERLLAEGRLADVTDDAQVFERVGWPVVITAGDAGNVKITSAGDVEVARGMTGERFET